MKKYFALLPCIILASLSPSASAVESAGAQILNIPPLARPAAMGEAYSAVADDSGALFYNPAGLGTIYYTEVPFSNNNLFEGINHQFGAFVYSLRDVRTTNVNDMGTIAVGYASLDSGDMVGRNAAGAATGNFSVQDQVVTAAYGKKVYDTERTGTIFAGTSVKLITEKFKDSSFRNVAFDAGALWHLPDAQTSVGVVARNFGPSLSYREQSAELPYDLSIGVAYWMVKGALLLSAENANRGFGIGAEYLALNSLAFRAGYNTKADQGNGLSLGFGVQLFNVDVMFNFAREVDLDYAFIPYGELGDTHRISLTLKLGAD